MQLRLQKFCVVTGTSDVLKQLLTMTSVDDSIVTTVDKMVVKELLNSGQSFDVILDCLKVHYSLLNLSYSYRFFPSEG